MLPASGRSNPSRPSNSQPARRAPAGAVCGSRTSASPPRGNILRMWRLPGILVPSLLILSAAAQAAVAPGAVQPSTVEHRPLGGALHPVAGSRQALLVTTPDWTHIGGVAQRYERAADGRWQRVGAACQIVVGKTGLAWGRGLVDSAGFEGPQKQEGDGKAPAGIFPLVSAFGYGATADTRLPYLQLTDSIECPDDPASSHYNTLVDDTKIAKDW